MAKLPIQIRTSINFGKNPLVDEIRKVKKERDWSLNKTMINLITVGLNSLKRSDKRRKGSTYA